jgi:hypothetical protein
LVVGGIYLAAINRTSKDRGAWLVVDQDPPELSGVEYRSVLSTQGAQHPLLWAHPESLQVIPDLVACASLWVSFSSATAWILRASRSAGDRDEVQERRKKRRLSDFWSSQSIGIFPDEVAPSERLRGSGLPGVGQRLRA